MSTYSGRLKARLDPKHPSNRSFPGVPKLGGEVLDRIAEAEFQKKMYGGFSKKDKCSECNELRSKNGSCSCS